MRTVEPGRERQNKATGGKGQRRRRRRRCYDGHGGGCTWDRASPPQEHAGFSLRDKEEVPHGAAGCEGGMRGQARGLAAHKTASFTKFRLLRLTITGSILTLRVKLKISRRGGLSIMHPSGSRQTQMSAWVVSGSEVGYSNEPLREQLHTWVLGGGPRALLS